jgi:hypothetical protein
MLHRMAALCFALRGLPLFEISRLLVPFDHIASVIVNANQTLRVIA